MTRAQAPATSLRVKLILSLVSILVSVLAAEAAVRWIYVTPYQWERRLMFFSEGRNFRNTDWGGFVYQPHAQVHARTYYITNLNPIEIQSEYDYRYTTNGHGLVQRREFDKSKPAILFLGDSFTEGQGATPWFYGLEHEWPDESPYQIVNGGIVGTGVEAWGRLYKSLSTDLQVAKVVILFISDDWTRVLWQFSQRRLECLKVGSACEGTEDFYGLSEDPVEAQTQIQHVAQYRREYLSQLRSRTNVLSRSSIYTNLLTPAFDRLARLRHTGSFDSQEHKQFEISKNIAGQIVTDLGRDNVLFIYLPQKSEIETGPQSFGRQAIDFVRANGFPFVDGRAKCGLSIRDYYQRDGHPNAGGYAKIATCVRDAVRITFAS